MGRLGFETQNLGDKSRTLYDLSYLSADRPPHARSHPTTAAIACSTSGMSAVPVPSSDPGGLIRWLPEQQVEGNLTTSENSPIPSP